MESANYDYGHLVSGLAAALPRYRWFGAKSRALRSCSIADVIHMESKRGQYAVLIVRADFEGAEKDRPSLYVLPVMRLVGVRAQTMKRRHPEAVLYEDRDQRKGLELFVDATLDSSFNLQLLQLALKGRAVKGRSGLLKAEVVSGFERRAGLLARKRYSPKPLRGEQSNTSIQFGNDAIVKILRRLDAGINPDAEVGRFLAEKRRFKNTPSLLAEIRYYPNEGGAPATLACVHEFVVNDGDAWSVCLAELLAFAQKKLKQNSRAEIREAIPAPPEAELLVAQKELSQAARLSFWPFLVRAEKLGIRTAEMHLALSEDSRNEAFAPQALRLAEQKEQLDRLLTFAQSVLTGLRQHRADFSTSAKELAGSVLEQESKILKSFLPLKERLLKSMQIRTHGDYHLGQVLASGDDFFVLDFEGEPARSLEERRLKLSPLRDVAGMLRSFHYASHVALTQLKPSARDLAVMEPWLQSWYDWVSVAYLQGYFRTIDKCPLKLLPESQADRQLLLNVYLMEKALYELVYEMNNRPDWVRVPLNGLLALLETAGETS